MTFSVSGERFVDAARLSKARTAFSNYTRNRHDGCDFIFRFSKVLNVEQPPNKFHGDGLHDPVSCSWALEAKSESMKVTTSNFRQSRRVIHI